MTEQTQNEPTEYTLENLDAMSPEIIENICRVLECKRDDISRCTPIKSGYTNVSFTFMLGGKKYVYRHPGASSKEITNRHAECFSQEIARDLGIDATFICEDPEEGWKISHFIENSRYLDYHDEDDVRNAMQMIRKLHTCGKDCGYELDLHEDTLKQMQAMGQAGRVIFDDFEELFELANGFNSDVMNEGVAPVLCHNDFYADNFLITDDSMSLIDWEFTGMSDYASDLGVFIACCPDYEYEDALNIYEMYFGRELTPEELYHCVAYTCVVSFHWLVWALYKEVLGESVGELLDYYHRYARLFGEKALELKESM